eukprot:scaffold42375_cov66-Phaeocystis_antarctica.AAC.1
MFITALETLSGKVQKARKHVGVPPPRPKAIRIHVGVDQRCRARDGESPAILPTMSTCNVPSGRWTIGYYAW